MPLFKMELSAAKYQLCACATIATDIYGYFQWKMLHQTSVILFFYEIQLYYFFLVYTFVEVILYLSRLWPTLLRKLGLLEIKMLWSVSVAPCLATVKASFGSLFYALPTSIINK